MHKTCSARLSHSDLSMILFHFCGIIPTSQFEAPEPHVPLAHIPNFSPSDSFQSPLPSSHPETVPPAQLFQLAASPPERITVVPIFFMHLYVTTGWPAVRLATIDCPCLHPTKHPSFGTLQLFPHLVTVLRPPDPNAPALLVSPTPAAGLCCHIFAKKRDSVSEFGLQASFNNVLCYHRAALNTLKLASFQCLSISEIINIFPGSQNTNIHPDFLRIHPK